MSSGSPAQNPRLRMRMRAVAMALIAVLCLAPARARAETSSIGSTLVGLGAGACTLVYTPVKIVYVGSGLIVSGLVYLWSVGDVARAGRVALVAVGGDYVVTPDHLTGDRNLRFTGERRRGGD